MVLSCAGFRISRKNERAGTSFIETGRMQEMGAATPTVQTVIEFPLEDAGAFNDIVKELQSVLGSAGIRIEALAGNAILHIGAGSGTVNEWSPPERIDISWEQSLWSPGSRTRTHLTLEADRGCARLTVACSGLGIEAGAPAWGMQEILAPLLRSVTPGALGDWLTDRHARRPSGPMARATYRAPLYHYPGFLVMLEELALTPHDYLLDVGCGGGALLRDALRSGCRAAGVDHSPEMVAVAREANAEAISGGRLEIHLAEAHGLPFPDGQFSCATMMGVLGFLRDPVKVMSEIRRVLSPEGRAIIAGTDPELRGTPAAPEPMASRLQFYDDSDLYALAQHSGFTRLRVLRRNLESYARQVGVPEEHLPLFGGWGTRFLLVQKD